MIHPYIASALIAIAVTVGTSLISWFLVKKEVRMAWSQFQSR